MKVENDFCTRNEASLHRESQNFDLVLYKNEVKLGLVGQIPRSFRGMLEKYFLGGVKGS